jgi:hypothetical protein
MLDDHGTVVGGQGRRGWLGRDDRGAVVPLVALGMVVLVGFVGFAVDVGMVFNERRQEQSAVDAATLSVARMSFEEVGLTPEDLFDEVVRLSLENMDGSVDEAEWRQRFLECTDPGRVAAGYPLALPTDQGTVDCISFDGFPASAVRVRLPDTAVSTTFASVLGFDEWTVSAFAEAGLTEQPAPNVIPFALSDMGSEGGRYCLREPQGNQGTGPTEDCNQGMFQGNTGVIQITRPSYTAIPCNQGQGGNGGHDSVIERNIAMGIDHFLSIYEGAEILEGCATVTAGLQPNTIYTGTGNANSNPVERGLIVRNDGFYEDGGPARLKRGPFPKTLDIKGHLVDDKPLWEFIDTSLDFGVDVPAICDPAAILAGFPDDPRFGLDHCFSQYYSGGYDTALFTMELIQSPRFTWVPESTDDLRITNGTSRPFRIKQFRPVFIQSIYYQTNNNCWWGFDPALGQRQVPVDGELPNCNWRANASLHGLGAYFFQLEMLPQQILDQGITAGGSTSRIALIR